jgi:phage gp29-like protein
MTDYITTKHGLLVPTAAFAEAVAQAPELNEIASIDRDPTKLFFGKVLRNDDDTLLTRGQGKGLKIYDELERDTHAYSVLQKRKLAVVARKWLVTPASDSPDDKRAAEFITETLKGISFDRICMELLDATNKGFSVGEVMWAIKPSAVLGRDAIVPSDSIARNQNRFTFGKDRDERWAGYPMRLLTRENMYDGVELPLNKFIVHRFGSKDGSPYGLGLGHKLFWPVFFKRQGITFWLTFCDKFGSPTVLGKYPRGSAKAEQGKLLDALRAFANDVGVIVPEGTEVELLEATRAGNDTYEKLARYMDEQMSEAVLGETMTTSAAGAGLGSGQANVQNDVRNEVSQADSDLLSDTLNGSLIKWLIDYNVPGAGYPMVSRNFEEEEDLNKRAERDIKIGQLGFEPDQDYITNTYGPGWKKKATPPPPTPGALPLFAEATGDQRLDNRAAQDAMAAAAAQFSEQWDKLIGDRVAEIQAIADETGDLVEFRERIAKLVDVEPPKALVEALARAQFASNLGARSNRTRG